MTDQPGERRPTVGRVVLYALSEGDVDEINRTRAVAALPPTRTGNAVHAGDEFPMVVVRVWPGAPSVNGQVLLDGDDSYWATSRVRGDGPGCWRWPDLA